MPPGRGEIIRREYVRSKELLPNVNHLLFPQNLALHFLLKQLTSQHGKHNCGHRLTGPQCPREQCDLGQHTQPLGIQPRVKQRGWHSSKVIKSLKYMKKNLKIQKKSSVQPSVHHTRKQTSGKASYRDAPKWSTGLLGVCKRQCHQPHPPQLDAVTTKQSKQLTQGFFGILNKPREVMRLELNHQMSLSWKAWGSEALASLARTLTCF